MSLKTETIVLVNTFHNTSISVQAKCTDFEKEWILSKGQVKQIKQELCGVLACACGGIQKPFELMVNRHGKSYQEYRLVKN